MKRTKVKGTNIVSLLVWGKERTENFRVTAGLPFSQAEFQRRKPINLFAKQFRQLCRTLLTSIPPKEGKICTIVRISQCFPASGSKNHHQDMLSGKCKKQMVNYLTHSCDRIICSMRVPMYACVIAHVERQRPLPFFTESADIFSAHHQILRSKGLGGLLIYVCSKAIFQ